MVSLGGKPRNVYNYSILTLLGGLTKHTYYVVNHVLDSQLELVDNDMMAPYVLGSKFPLLSI